MSYTDLEDNFDQKKVFLRYNVELEGPAVKPEDDEEVAAILPTEEPFREIALALLYEDMDKVATTVKKALDDGVSPIEVINGALMKGMDGVSALYTKGTYFLPDLMLAGDCLMAGVKDCEDVLGHKSDTKGTVVSFAAEGDPHDIGKNLILMFLRAGGFEAVDLGRDVPADVVVEATKENKPIMLTGTALMTTTMTAFPKVVEALKEAGLEVPVGCGGGAVRRDYVESYPMSFYGVEAYHTPKLAEAIVEDKATWEDIRKKYQDIVGEFVSEYS